MKKTIKNVLKLIAASAITLSISAPVRAEDCRAEYDRRIDHIEHKLAKERDDVRREHDRLERAYREHRGSPEHKEELRRDLERAKGRLRRAEQVMGEKRAEAKRELHECEERHRHHH